MVVRESDLTDWNFLAKLGFQEQNCLWVNDEFQVDLDRRVVIGHETIPFTTPEQLLRIVSYRVWYADNDPEKEITFPNRFYVPRSYDQDRVYQCVLELEKCKEFYGLIFCYTDDGNGYMISRRYSNNGTVEIVAEIPSGE